MNRCTDRWGTDGQTHEHTYCGLVSNLVPYYFCYHLITLLYIKPEYIVVERVHGWIAPETDVQTHEHTYSVLLSIHIPCSLLLTVNKTFIKNKRINSGEVTRMNRWRDMWGTDGQTHGHTYNGLLSNRIPCSLLLTVNKTLLKYNRINCEEVSRMNR